jgi:hypothetical protein
MRSGGATVGDVLHSDPHPVEQIGGSQVRVRPIPGEGRDGKLVDVQINWFDDCQGFTGAWLKLQLGERLTPENFKPPLEDPDWLATLDAEFGFNSHVVTVSGLRPEEIATMCGPDLQVDVTADQDGVAAVPALVGLSTKAREVTVERLSKLPFDGAIRLDTVEFDWLGSTEDAAIADRGGTPQLARRVRGSVQVEEFDVTDVRRFVVGGTSLNPQPLPPGTPEALRLAEAAGLREVAGTQVLPRNSGRVVVARLRDGIGLVVTADREGPRVTGRYSGPMVGA